MSQVKARYDEFCSLMQTLSFTNEQKADYYESVVRGRDGRVDIARLTDLLLQQISLDIAMEQEPVSVV